jgi:hypothetical protein
MARSPVLLIAFNRPDFTAQSIQSIVDQEPPVLYVACDGARTPHERAAVERTREVVLSNARDHVELRTRFREENLGCKRAVEDAISWFLNEVPEGLIVEDDCVPSPAFFRFADELLERYRDDPAVMHIGGYCHTPSTRPGYSYSRFPAVWGWATWRRAWAHYPVVLPDMTSERRADLRAAFTTTEELDYFAEKWDAVQQGRLDTWDFSWCFAVLANHGLAVQPHQNLVRNIGVGDSRAAHTTRARTGSFDHAVSPGGDDLLIAPEFRVPDFTLDREFFASSVTGRLRRLKRVVRRGRTTWRRFVRPRVGQ